MNIYDMSVDEIIKKLSPIENQILFELGNLDISVNKNVNIKTIKKKMPDKYLAGFPYAFKHLVHLGIIVKYRPDNYGVSKEGRKITHTILENRRKIMYKGLRIIQLVM